MRPATSGRPRPTPLRPRCPGDAAGPGGSASRWQSGGLSWVHISILSPVSRREGADDEGTPGSPLRSPVCSRPTAGKQLRYMQHNT